MFIQTQLVYEEVKDNRQNIDILYCANAYNMEVLNNETFIECLKYVFHDYMIR